MGAYANSIAVFLCILGFIFTGRLGISNKWVFACIATLFAMSVAAMSITLISVLSRNQGMATYEWTFTSGLIASLGLVFVAVIGSFFAFVASRELKLKYTKMLLGLVIQTIAFYLIFAYGLRLVHKFLDQ